MVPERVLHRTAAYPHQLGLPIEPHLHRFEHRFMLPARDAAIVTSGAARLQRAARTGRAPVLADRPAVLDRGEAEDCPLARRAAVLIVTGDVDEVAFVEAALGPGIGGQHNQSISCASTGRRRVLDVRTDKQQAAHAAGSLWYSGMISAGAPGEKCVQDDPQSR